MIWSSGLRNALLPKRSSEKGGRWSVLTDHLQHVLIENIDFSAVRFPARTPETAVICGLRSSQLDGPCRNPPKSIAGMRRCAQTNRFATPGWTMPAPPPGDAPPPGNAPRPGGATKLRQVMRLWFLLPLVGTALVHVSHLNMNAFLSWERQGIRVDVISLLVALAALSEAAVFFLIFRFSGRLRARTWILLAALVTVLRWAAMTPAHGLGWLIVLQSLHGSTFGMGFLACTMFIANWTSADITAEAQGFFMAIQQGLSVVSVTVFGILLADRDASAFWLGPGLAALGSLAIALSLRLQPPAGCPMNLTAPVAPSARHPAPPNPAGPVLRLGDLARSATGRSPPIGSA